MTAAVTFQPVAIVDPGTGARSYVDAARRLSTYDPIAGYRNNPANRVSLRFDQNRNSCIAVQYVVPTGKALVISSLSGYAFQYTTTDDQMGFWLADGPSCSGILMDGFKVTPSKVGNRAPNDSTYSPGRVVKAGKHSVWTRRTTKVTSTFMAS